MTKLPRGGGSDRSRRDTSPRNKEVGLHGGDLTARLAKVKAMTPFLSCFICKGAHQVSKCAQKTTLCVLQAKLEINSEAEYEMVEKAIPLARTVGHPRVGALKYLSALQKRVEEIEEQVECGLM